MTEIFETRGLQDPLTKLIAILRPKGESTETQLMRKQITLRGQNPLAEKDPSFIPLG